MTRVAAALVALLLVLAPARAAEPLVDVAWVKANLGRPGVLLLDVRSGAGRTRADYLAGHIPGAVFTDYGKDGWRERTKDGIEGQLPPAERLEALIGRLGIDNATHVVLIPEGRNAADMGAATRLYWTFKVLGHDNLSILNGGFFAWVREVDKDKKPVNPLETTDVRPAPRSFKAALRHGMLVGAADVEKAMADSIAIVDNRPQDFHVGLTRSFAARRAGTIPGARSLPESWLTDNNGGTFRTQAQLARLYQAQSVPTAGPQIMFCNTGHWASLGWFVSSEMLGNKDARLYSGSMAEWTADPRRPVEVKVKAD
jgi:thiosulfate/3-mercaptopyruvate sulfurtransferase